MNYFFRTNGFNLDKYDFDIKVIPRFTKKEQNFFEVLLDNFKEKEEYSKINKMNIKLNQKDMKKLIFSLMKKTVYCYVDTKDKKRSELYFSIFNFIITEGEEIIYKFSKEIENARKLGNFYTRINLLGILKFKYENTKEIYKIILKKSEKTGSMEYTLDQLKEVLNLKKDNYNRYYNLEAKILKPIVKDIESANIVLEFEKIKKTSSKTSRVIGIRFHYRDSVMSQIHKDTNELMKMYSKYIKDFVKTYKLIYNYKKFNTINDTIKYIEKNHDDIFSDE